MCFRPTGCGNLKKVFRAHKYNGKGEEELEQLTLLPSDLQVWPSTFLPASAPSCSRCNWTKAKKFGRNLPLIFADVCAQFRTD